jgi:hypothetical protein
MSQPQLYWDTQDCNTPGWWLRYYDAAGNELGVAIDGEADDPVEELAHQVDHLKLDDLTGRIRVFRRDALVGHIRVVYGDVMDWRAL